MKKAILGLLGLLTLLSLCCCNLFPERLYARQNFDSSRWKAYGDSADNRRYEMLDDLLNHHLIKGMTTTEVVDLLGTPEKQSDSGLYYNCGLPKDAFFFIDPVILWITMKDGRVVSWKYGEG